MEKVGRVLFFCPFAKVVWKTSPLRVIISDEFPHFWSQSWSLLVDQWSSSPLKDDLCSLGALICWNLWKVRNDYVFQDIQRDVAEVIYQVNADFSEFSEASRFKSMFSPRAAPVPSSSSPWTPPMEGSFKLNVDASFDSQSKVCGGGLILRDCKELAEAFVLREGIRLLRRCGYVNVVVERDCQNVMRRSPQAPLVAVVLEEFLICLVSLLVLVLLGPLGLVMVSLMLWVNMIISLPG
ncbi:uncharacterized protein LOC132309676 [Cornus florida]|uniref:uncharacterized protein LOC132309676 n=1 Tax=Cornus florida TaxID=4283 RepID=UPI0028982BF7|nr:uncharacterized protein LOC132309676 [Cornus florida]